MGHHTEVSSESAASKSVRSSCMYCNQPHTTTVLVSINLIQCTCLWFVNTNWGAPS